MAMVLAMQSFSNRAGFGLIVCYNQIKWRFRKVQRLPGNQTSERANNRVCNRESVKVRPLSKTPQALAHCTRHSASDACISESLIYHSFLLDFHSFDNLIRPITNSFSYSCIFIFRVLKDGKG